MLAYSKNAPIVNFRSVVPPGQFKRETEAFGGAFYYDRKEGMIVTELEYSEEDTNILKGSLTLKKPVHDDETIEDAMKTCIKEVVNFLSPKK